MSGAKENISNISLSTRFFSFSFPFEIFVGKIPRDLFEDELVPLFEKAGPIWDLRLMMDPLSGLNRGYAFVTFCTKEAAQEAVKLVHLFETSTLVCGPSIMVVPPRSESMSCA